MEVIELPLNEAAIKNIGLMKLSLGKSFFPNLEAIFYSIFRFTTSKRVAVTRSTLITIFIIRIVATGLLHIIKAILMV